MKTNVETVARGKASVYTHQTASTQFIEAAGIRLAYRRFANRRFGYTDYPFSGQQRDDSLSDPFCQQLRDCA